MPITSGIRLYGFLCHGFFTARELHRFAPRPGVYIASCACGAASGGHVVEIGEASDVQSYLLTHFGGRESCACHKGARGAVYYAAFYCPEGGKHDRKEILAKILKREEAARNSSAKASTGASRKGSPRRRSRNVR